MKRVLDYLNNYFYRWGERGKFKIENGTINVERTLLKGQYVAIKGSVLNDGVYRVENYLNGVATLTGMENEEFEGIVLSLAIPKELMDMPTKIDEYEKEVPITNNIVSESYGNYSYTMATNSNGEKMTWKDVYANDLKPYRKMVNNLRYVEINDKKVK